MTSDAEKRLSKHYAELLTIERRIASLRRHPRGNRRAVARELPKRDELKRQVYHLALVTMAERD